MGFDPRLLLASLLLIGCWGRQPAAVAKPCPSETAPAAATATVSPPEAVAGLNNEELMAQRIAKACVANEPGACARLAKTLARREEAPSSPVSAPAREPSKPKDDEADRQAALGRKLLQDPGPERLLAPDHLKKACDLGHPGACNDLGWAWSTGFGTLQSDRNRAASLYEKACDMGDALGCANRARLARSINTGLAAEFFAKGCEKKLEDACVELAGTVRDAEEACKKSNAACSNWGYILEEGLGVKADPVKGLAAYDRACAAKDAVACYNAAVSYQEGISGKADPVKAKARFEAGCKLKHDRSCREISSAIPATNRR